MPNYNHDERGRFASGPSGSSSRSARKVMSRSLERSHRAKHGMMAHNYVQTSENRARFGHKPPSTAAAAAVLKKEGAGAQARAGRAQGYNSQIRRTYQQNASHPQDKPRMRASNRRIGGSLRARSTSQNVASRGRRYVKRS